MQTTGIHHVTAICSDAQDNLDFYTKVLGLRLVKKTVNFDDPSTYHFYFGDTTGRPGSILTFFPWANLPRGRRGHGSTDAVAFSVPPDSLPKWKTHLESKKVATEFINGRFGVNGLTFDDPDGMCIELLEDCDSVDEPFYESGNLSPDMAVRGIHSVTLIYRTLDTTAPVIINDLGYESVGTENNRTRYKSTGLGIGLYIDMLVNPDAKRAQQGAGSVHHVAFRSVSDEQQVTWQKLLLSKGFNVSPVMDRTYFHSIYFREPAGVLFEIATDAPGMTIDEPKATLGQSLCLPTQYEAHRKDIENALPKLRL